MVVNVGFVVEIRFAIGFDSPGDFAISWRGESGWADLLLCVYGG